MECKICGADKAAKLLRICGACLKKQPEDARAAVEAAHRRSRRPLPGTPPKTPGGIVCQVCANNCRLAPDEASFCGLRVNREGRLRHLAGTARRGVASWYHDPLPTNCVADWVCPAGSSSGYPRYSYRPGVEHGYYNLAVFLGGCSFDCLFCQNRQYHEMAVSLEPLVKPEELAAAIRKDTACICYFGGDPSPQVPFALKAARLAVERARGRVLRVCWETNGNINPRLLGAVAELSLASGGCVKFDLKCYNDDLHRALTGVSNRQTLANFSFLAELALKRPDPPFLIASTLLVPGYVDTEEVAAVAKFIAGLDPQIPYSLLAFYPQHLMHDLPCTSRADAEACRQAALDAGLKRVRLGNIHLLR
ncbi:MAG TPA: radical SAM protein [Desulfotomaculum sp.]|nr:radical SAM protein [Desulfotomaculum sp.]